MDIKGFCVFVPVSDIQLPCPVEYIGQLNPVHGNFFSCNYQQHFLLLINAAKKFVDSAETFHTPLKILWVPIGTLRLVYDSTGCGMQVLKRYISWKTSEPCGKLLKRYLLTNCFFTDLLKQCIPISLMLVQSLQFLSNFYVGNIGNKSRISKIISCSGKTTCELESNCKTFLNIMESGNLKFWKVKAFSTHIYTDHYARPSCDQICLNFLTLLHGLDAGVYLYRIEFCIAFI